MLFDPKELTDQDTKNHGETDWEYLDRSGRVEAQRVRDLLTSWLSSYPDAHKAELVSRMRGGDDTEFQAAAFELLLFSALSALGCSVEVHPELPIGTRHPDFLATTPTGDAVYVEAVLASEFSQEAQAARRRTKVVLDAIEKVDSPDFFVGVSADGDPQTPPSGRRLRRELERWISGLDYDAVIADLSARGTAPSRSSPASNRAGTSPFMPTQRNQAGVGRANGQSARYSAARAGAAPTKPSAMRSRPKAAAMANFRTRSLLLSTSTRCPWTTTTRWGPSSGTSSMLSAWTTVPRRRRCVEHRMGRGWGRPGLGTRV